MVRTVRIFLSSPGDVATERTKLRDLLLGLARAPFLRGKVHIDVVSWDDPQAPAQMDARFTPQQAVDRSLPTPAECDLTIVLLWSRMGTPLTDTRADGTPYLSGTEWEFETALGANKPVYLYRRSEKVLLDPDEAEFDAKLTQKRRVDDFFARLKNEDGTIRHAHASYAAVDDLLTRVRQDVEGFLSTVLRDDDDKSVVQALRPVVSGGPEGPHYTRKQAPPDVPVAYREWVKKQCGGVDLLGLRLKKGRPPSLSTIYVPQTTIGADEGGGAQRQRRPDNKEEMLGRERERPTLLLNRLAHESLYVSGAPGTGKSTFCRWVAWLVADGAMPTPEVNAPDGFAESLDAGLRGRLPILLRLREFWEYLPVRVSGSLTRSDLERAMGDWIDRKQPDGLDSRLLLDHLEQGDALLVLDGMDEVPVSATADGRKWLPREALVSALADACPRWSQQGHRVLLTSRPYGLSPERAATLSLGFAPLQTLPRELQSLLAERWFSVLAGELSAGKPMAADLFSNIDPQPWLVELAANPLLLTAMCIVYDEGKRLPQDKHDLYERVVATVLYSRYQDPADIDRAKRELAVVAYGMHVGNRPDDRRLTPKAEATFVEVDDWLKTYQDRKDYTERAEADAFASREALLSQSGLLLSTGEARAGFAHLSFQEFFAAQRAFTVDEARLADVFLERAATEEWRNTLSFLYGRLVSVFPEPKKAIDLLEGLLEGASAREPGLALVLGEAAQILTGKGTALRPASLERLQSILLDGMTGPAAVRERAAMGSALGRLGDPRFRGDLWGLPSDDLLGFIKIEAGPFTMGSDPRRDRYAPEREQPQHNVDLSEFYVARYAVTVAQFRAFVEDAKFSVGNASSLRGTPNHPVVNVSWHDALAYCHWLTAKLRSSDSTPHELRDRLNGGWVVTLPSEAEWEKAARGQDGRVYPWGDTFDAANANCFEGKLGTTSSVGVFPSGASPHEALDMSGNVWEWTRSLWGSDYREPSSRYPYSANSDETEHREAGNDILRVLRGGSFVFDEYNLRAANRSGGFPEGRFDDDGFRVVASRLRS